MKPNAFLRYSGMATQMAITILAAVFLGRWLDEKYATNKTWTLILSLVGVVVAMYNVIKNLLRK